MVADSRMVAYHGANLQHYVLTLMSIVSVQPGRVDSPTDCFLVVTEPLSAVFLCNAISLPSLGMEIMLGLH